MKEKKISLEAINSMRNDFYKSSKYRALQNVVARTDIKQVALNWDKFATVSHTFSDKITPELAATSQSQSGRCWIFAVLNLLRIPMAEKHNINDFEFSQSYLFLLG